MKKQVILSAMVLLFSCVFTNAIAQGSKPAALKYKHLSIGDKLPDIVLKNIINCPKKNAKVSDFKGKLLIIDFWSTGCSSCIKGFPKMEKLQEQFKDELQVILINPWETITQIDKEFQRVKKYRPDAKVYLPSLPGINGDSIWLKLFPMFSIPTHVWIDASGKVIAITQGYNATPEHVQAVLDNKIPDMVIKNDMAERELLYKGYVQPTLPSMPPVYYSLFVPYYGAAGGGGGHENKSKGTIRMTFCNNSPIDLFKTAFGDYTDSGRKIIIEATNKEQYEKPADDNLIDDWSKKYLFTYELQLSQKDKTNWQSIMQQDVNRFLGATFGIEGKIEKRQYEDEGIVDVLVIKDKS